MSEENKTSEVSESLSKLETLREKYLDLLIQTPLSYQTHEMVAIRDQIRELKEKIRTDG